MQYFSGGWKYWEDDDFANDHVTPYVVRSLFTFRDLGVDIPQASIDSGIAFIIGLLDNGSSDFEADPDFRAEVFWTLARAKNDRAKILQKVIDPSKLSRHGYLAYAYGLHYLGQYSDTIDKRLVLLMNAPQDTDYWYWDKGADDAIYAQLLLDLNRTQDASIVLDNLLRDTDLSSYYVSTQEKIQLFLALVKHTSLTAVKSVSQIAVRAQ